MNPMNRISEQSLNHYKANGSFKGKNVIVTGATGGIGSILVQTLCELGANVVIIARNEKKVLTLFQHLIDTKSLQYKIIDLSGIIVSKDFEEVMLMLNGKLDMLLMCHGQFFIGDISEATFKEFDEATAINTRSMLALLSLSTEFLKRSKGCVVAISSLESYIPVSGSFLNSISKSMVNSLIENAALELASFGVRVNGVAPGITYTSFRVGINDDFQESTNQTYMQNMGKANLLNNEVIKPEDVVESILFLASDDASFITGEIIKIDNGYSLNHDMNFTDFETGVTAGQ